jgi:hypothetical protein
MPQLEMPELVLDAVTGWLARHPDLNAARPMNPGVAAP